MEKREKIESSNIRRKQFRNSHRFFNWGSVDSDSSVSSVTSFSNQSSTFWSLQKGYRGSLLKLSDEANNGSFKLNIALKYSRLEDSISIILFKCISQVIRLVIFASSRQLKQPFQSNVGHLQTFCLGVSCSKSP